MSYLKKLYVARGPGDDHVLRGLLESAGVRSVIRGDDFVPLQGGNLMRMETWSSVWVLEDDTYPRALEIAEEYARRAEEAPAQQVDTWRCPRCREDVERQFTECWSCGTDRPPSQLCLGIAAPGWEPKGGDTLPLWSNHVLFERDGLACHD